MSNSLTLFQCGLCKKFRNPNLLASIDKKGFCICQLCVDEICDTPHYFVNGKKVTKKEYDKYTKKDKEK